jgi:methylisocitrate lyase
MKMALSMYFQLRGTKLNIVLMANNDKAASAGVRLRAAVEAERPLQVAGAITAYAARMAEATGFRALYLSGGGVAANSLGMPDLGISTMDDVLIDIRRITEASTLPLLVDADTGWGGAFNIARTVRSFIKAGAAGLHIEDQVPAKRCGHRPGKEIVSQEEMVDRIKAAVDARTDDAFVIMARTDALAVEGIERAIERARACVEAGADMVFPEAITELSMYRRFKDAVNVPILANITEFGHTPLYTRDELGAVGVDIVLYCCSAYRAMNAAALKTYEAIRRDGTQKNVLDSMQTRADLYRYLGYLSYEEKLDRLFAASKDHKA